MNSGVRRRTSTANLPVAGRAPGERAPLCNEPKVDRNCRTAFERLVMIAAASLTETGLVSLPIARSEAPRTIIEIQPGFQGPARQLCAALNARDDSGNPLQYNAPARSRRKLAESESTAALAGDQSLSCRPATVKRSRIL